MSAKYNYYSIFTSEILKFVSLLLLVLRKAFISHHDTRLLALSPCQPLRGWCPWSGLAPAVPHPWAVRREGVGDSARWTRVPEPGAGCQWIEDGAQGWEGEEGSVSPRETQSPGSYRQGGMSWGLGMSRSLMMRRRRRMGLRLW